jgi:hypothetical protein
VATSNGYARLYTNYHHNNQSPLMFTAIKTATDVSSRTKGLDMLKCWQQKCVTLIADGDLEQVKIRDMKLELNGVYRV